MWPIACDDGLGDLGGSGSNTGVYCSDELDRLNQQPLEWADDEIRCLARLEPPPSTPTSSVRRRKALSEHVSSIAFPSALTWSGPPPFEVSSDITKSFAKTRLRTCQSDAAVIQATRSPIRLDRRRLDKAVSLAIEAAQVSERDERAWRHNDRQRRAQSSTSRHLPSTVSNPYPAARNGGRQTRFSRLRSLGWKRASLDLSHCESIKGPPPGTLEGHGGHNATLIPFQADEDGVSFAAREAESGGGESSTLDDGRESSSQDGLHGDLSDVDELPPASDDFSVDLYISALGYLLAALRPEDAVAVRDSQRKELIGKLRDALRHLESSGEQQGTASVKLGDQEARRRSEEEVIVLYLQQKLGLLQQDIRHDNDRTCESGYAVTNAAYAQTPDTSQRPTQADRTASRRSLTGFLTSSALDFGLTLGAGMVAAAARGVANLLPAAEEVPPTDAPAEEMMVGSASADPSSRGGQSSSVYGRRSCTSGIAGSELTKHSANSTALMSGPQWDLTRGLVGSISSTLYNHLAAVAHQQRHRSGVPSDPKASDVTQANTLLMVDTHTDHIGTTGTQTGEFDAADRLIELSATLARSVKRSPLPTQVRTLAWQVACVASALDKRYSLSQRTVDVALRKAGQALTFARKNDLHVKTVRVAWALIEASVAAIEAYREEEGWSTAAKDHRTVNLPVMST